MLLHTLVFWFCIALALLTLGALIFSLLRYYREQSDHKATTLKKDLLWSFLALVILLVLLVPIGWSLF